MKEQRVALCKLKNPYKQGTDSAIIWEWLVNEIELFGLTSTNEYSLNRLCNNLVSENKNGGIVKLVAQKMKQRRETKAMMF